MEFISYGLTFFFELVLELFFGVEEASKILSLACQLCHCSSVSQAIKNIINSKSTPPIHNVVLLLPYLRPNINFAKKINTIAYKPNFSSYTTAYLKLYVKFVIKFTVFQNLHVTLEMYMYNQLHRQLHRHKQCSYCSIFKEIKNRLSFFILMHLRLVNGIFRFDFICWLFSKPVPTLCLVPVYICVRFSPPQMILEKKFDLYRSVQINFSDCSRPIYLIYSPFLFIILNEMALKAKTSFRIQIWWMKNLCLRCVAGYRSSQKAIDIFGAFFVLH